ncbi:hypothetical protein B9G98_03309 [Wickerhamiella sorbophila]|uniref:Uncharacterized protein n=1 Tax=Wickerhamiella sorbophila TaxID=45607 RepID=A0A2T0FL31_9ASCO|nr:hypothetical protein B9G98_03309 [Wickerhamiella sorbophila]PRT55689.1 hypothetical protein B9G98_03309 [Wickerhamiella sorbophila]
MSVETSTPTYLNKHRTFMAEDFDSVSERRAYASETAFLKARRIMANLADSTDALSTSEAHMLLTELCELCLDSDMALAMLENGFLDECVLLFRGNPTYTVQLVVTTFICICLHCRVGRAYYSRNLTHTTKFLVEMLKNTRAIPDKLNRYYESSNIAKANVLPLAFTAFAWPHLIIPESPVTPDVPKEYETMGRQIFESSKSYIEDNQVLPPLPPFAECEYVNGTIKTCGAITEDFTISNLAVHCLFMLLDAGELTRFVFKRQAPYLHKMHAVQSVFERNSMNHKLYLIELLNLNRLVQDNDALSSFENTLWRAFQQYALDPAKWALQGKYALQALIILESNCKSSVLKSKRHKVLLQKYLLELDTSGVDVQDPCVAMAWGLALLLGENFVSKSFLGLLISKMIKGFQNSRPYNPHHAYICWVVGAFFLQGYLEIPAVVLRRMIDCIEQFGAVGTKLEMMAKELEKKLPEQRYCKSGQKRASEGFNPPAKHIKRAPKFAHVVGPSSTFFWGLASQLYLSRIHTVCEDTVSPWNIVPEYIVTEQQLYPDTPSSPKVKPTEAIMPPNPVEELSPPSLPPIPETTLIAPKTPQFSSEATVDWTPQSVRGFGESRHPTSIPPPLRLNSGITEPKIEEEVSDLSHAMPTFTAMFGLQESASSLGCQSTANVSGKLLPPAEISQCFLQDSAVLFSVSPAKFQTFNPSLESDSRVEPTSAFLRVPFTPVSASLGPAMH